jgi:hypothetical protein
MSVMLMGVGCPVATGLQHRIVITTIPDLIVPYPFGPAQALAAVKLFGDRIFQRSQVAFYSVVLTHEFH